MSGLYGVTTESLCALDEERPISTVFFKPYDSASDFFIRAAAILAVPVFCAFEHVYFAMEVFFQMFSCIYFFLSSDERMSDAVSRLTTAAINLVVTFIAIFASPLVELVDVAGSGISMLLP